MKKRLGTIAKVLIAALLVVVGATAVRIYTYGNNVVDVEADAAMVLGAAVWGNEVSPVFRERINHAIDLYRRGKVHKIIFRVLIVSDPMHMKRAVAMARDIGLEAYPSPTPTTRYQGWRSQMGSLAHETYYYMGYLMRRLM